MKMKDRKKVNCLPFTRPQETRKMVSLSMFSYVKLISCAIYFYDILFSNYD